MFERFDEAARDAFSTGHIIAAKTGAKSMRQEHLAAGCVAKLRDRDGGSNLPITPGTQKLLSEADLLSEGGAITVAHLLEAYKRGLERGKGR